MNAQIKKGILEMCILQILIKEELYGYDIMKKMNEHFPEVNESTFYSILRRLNKDGATETYLGEVSNGPKRKYYKVTDYGRSKLNEDVRSWKQINVIMTDLGIDLL
ncbi:MULTISPECIES: PadR family transcriptional regulator [unclassified Fusibacter]|uniref:PadR family transcriptional regulator n=1 Tax=unclassified Fusibacter TaxID=2624464 RepID=UPI00101153D5|nr:MULTISPECIES: PadR family transcriptional regulator [unclassified Fusibacter]MCK8059037.1 PadR family transcriptional regulator [Fusibacter sp. A2]NPE22448.1 PadR family transcriptional regulator [Fusibacter sp. A1]RXV60552.1 PadR family transcriptional regulator [Fusibacter sp. A1]